MMKIKVIMLMVSLIMLSSCIQDTINKFEHFTVQLPIFFKTDYNSKSVPDTSIDFTNLYEYKEYNDNKGKIDAAEVYQINYRIDSLVLENGLPFDPNEDDLSFDSVSFMLKFARPLPGKSEYSTNPEDFEPDPNSKLYILGKYKNVKVKDYYKTAYNIIQVPEENAFAISEGLRHTPYFYIYSQYSFVTGKYPNEVVFPFVRAKYDLVVRLKVKL
ncbi:MAG TPA: hypothetical protein PLE30_10385 [Candidatus Kapabacteria bacterium]|nr:hypothetical protein [Candidatus Kapabacteria bacterium]